MKGSTGKVRIQSNEQNTFIRTVRSGGAVLARPLKHSEAFWSGYMCCYAPYWAPNLGFSWVLTCWWRRMFGFDGFSNEDRTFLIGSRRRALGDQQPIRTGLTSCLVLVPVELLSRSSTPQRRAPTRTPADFICRTETRSRPKRSGCLGPHRTHQGPQ